MARWIIGAIFLLIAGASELRAQLIPPPFGLQWGETPERVQSLAGRTGSKAERRTEAPGRETFELTAPFPDRPFHRLAFTFETGQLIQVAVHYPLPEDGAGAKQLVTSLRWELERSLGPGELLETGTETNPDRYQEARRVFRWQRDGCAVWLISLELSNGSPGEQRREGEISVVYANLGLGRRLEIEGAGG
ncbi:MAG: hypothetical protein JO015_06095 [Verrucomicrobia bacterium]|nr:hypothetical protein [Verrucomicrobiota bacterium]